MRIIEINQLENGAHCNQTISSLMTIPEGWAVIPEDMEIPSTFPFVNIEVEDGVVTAMTEGVVPDPEPIPEVEDEPTTAELLDILLGVDDE